jgi:hypothetical protein
MSISIVVPSKFPDIFEEYRKSADRFASTQEKILVRDGHDIPNPPGWTTIQAPEGPFIYSRNVNLGLNQTSDDVLLMNDDCRFVSPDTVEAMEKILGACPDIGILSPEISGVVGNNLQSNVDRSVQYSDERLAFVCVLIRRSVIDRIGLLDERFVGYGWDDSDYCRRAMAAGFKLACTNTALVAHGHGSTTWSSSFSRTGINGHHPDNVKIYEQKWGERHYTPIDPNAPPAKSRLNGSKYSTDGLTIDWYDSHPRRR